VLRTLKDDPATKDIPVIICSIISDKNRGFSLGAADYLVKPIVENDLVKALKHLENQYKEQVKVLVVDDQADDILLIRRILEAQSHYRIFEANNGRESLELVESVEPDLIILDLTMPEMDGFMVVEALKDNEKTRSIPIIIVSAKELTPAEHLALTGQVEVLLRKGIFTENELLEDVSQALKRIHKEATV
jgi:CheY-like chemotaxis protein